MIKTATWYSQHVLTALPAVRFPYANVCYVVKVFYESAQSRNASDLSELNLIVPTA